MPRHIARYSFIFPCIQIPTNVTLFKIKPLNSKIMFKIYILFDALHLLCKLTHILALRKMFFRGNKKEDMLSSVSGLRCATFRSNVYQSAYRLKASLRPINPLSSTETESRLDNYSTVG